MITVADCTPKARVAYRNEPSEVEAGAPAVELGTIIEHRPGMSCIAGGPRVEVRWDSGERTWVPLAQIELSTDDLEDEYGSAVR